MTYHHIHTTFGRDARNRLGDANRPGHDGALAALETFYFAFNHRDLPTFQQVWVDDALIRLKNPLGGIMEGLGPITALYDGIFNGPASVWVEFHNIVAYELGGDAVVYSGQERGEFAKAGVVVPLEIRTTRVFHFANGRWGQVHHHGSITDTQLLDTYRRAVQS
ncbi:MAG: nuclear transport factor 2 family protein [Ilumatobacteraceae bacterium]